jgi:hypothetical protein
LILHTLDSNTTPEAYVTQWLNAWQQLSIKTSVDVFAVHFVHSAHYLTGHPSLELLALVRINESLSIAHASPTSYPDISITIFPSSPERISELEALCADAESVTRYCRQQRLPWVVISSPLLLDPVYIPKPWGQEIWYTGVEARGQARVSGKGGSLPLPWVMEFMQDRLGIAPLAQLILLKVLDPLAEEGYGDLYFELHEQKQEIYVVTHVDEHAWPDGRGAIQLGFNQAVLRQYATHDAFKAAYSAAVGSYEQTRRVIDGLLDKKKQQLGLALNEPVAAQQLMLWINELSQVDEYKELILREQKLKRDMNSFIAQYSLGVGDVVTVPRLVPHALQHGVRVVEFQTPVYERKILSFGQKVLTQEHWDTAEALSLADMGQESSVVPESSTPRDGVQIQRIVNFDEFEVHRIKLSGAYILEFKRYCLLIVLDGVVVINVGADSIKLSAGAVALIPANSPTPTWLNASPSCLLLQAIPRLA